MPRRLEQLDALRGLAAVSVVAGHCLCVPSAFDHTRLAWYLRHSPLGIIRAGYEAVVFFFLLSGFVLAIPFFSRPVAYGRFVLKRVCRIYIPYYAAMLLAVILAASCSRSEVPELGWWVNQTWTKPLTWSLVVQHVLLVGSFAYASLNTVIWSLVHEMRISLLFPLLMVLVTRRGWRMCLGVGVLSSVVGNGIGHAARWGGWSDADCGLTLHYVGLFIAGALLARHRAALSARVVALPRRAKSALALGAVLCYTSSLWLGPLLSRPVVGQLYSCAKDWGVAGGAAVFIVLALSSGTLARLLTTRPLLFLGRTSYSVYLLHGTVLLALVHLLYGSVPVWLIWALTVAITLPLSAISYRLTEVPSINLGRRLSSVRGWPSPLSGDVAAVPAVIESGRAEKA